MEREQFKIKISALRKKVWEILWSEKTYPQWTRPFSEGSRAVSDWKEGSKILFLNANNEGMVSRIAEKRENEFMSFEHLGMIDQYGREDTESEKVKAWSGSFENYTLKGNNGKTELTVEMDMEDSYRDFFRKTWPKALEKLKEMAEK